MELSLVSTSEAASAEIFSDVEIKESEVEASGTVIGSGRKNGGLKENGHSILNVSRIVSQIKKPPHRKSGSPLNWFPRKKIDSFLKRKIRLLQEDGGNLSLDETLGSSNPHYTKIAREKIAAREAARRAMEARKAAMVEASWCRILRAARIQSKEAEAELEKAEKCAAEAFEAATAKGVMMYDRPDCPRRLCEVESSSTAGGGSTHTVTASFETAFQVDKEVTAAVKKAFIQLANCPTSSNKEEFKDLLWKISQNPDTSETDPGLSDIISECESDADSSGDDAINGRRTEMEQRKCQYGLLCENNSSTPFTELVKTMLDRLKGLKDDELASLAIIVATCGLNAALLEVENSKDHEFESIRQGTGARRNSGITRFADGFLNRKVPVTEEVPSLDKFFVKHVSRLEREVQEAQNSRCQQTQGEIEVKDAESKHTTSELASDLGSILVKHVSKFEEEIQKAKSSQQNASVVECGKTVALSESILHGKDCKGSGSLQRHAVLDHMQQLGMESHETVSSYPHKESMGCNTLMPSTITTKERQQARELAEITNETSSGTEVGTERDWTNRSPVKHISRIERAKLEALKAFSFQEETDLDKILVKPVHWLAREKMQALEEGSDYTMQRGQKSQGPVVSASESLDKILVKHVSRLEKERLASRTKEGAITVKKRDQQAAKVESLDDILVKHQSKLEKAKLAASQQPADIIVKNRKQVTDVTASESLDKILVKHQPELEKAKLVAAAQQSRDYIKPVDRREARERELQEAWGGLSLGNSIQPHLSRLERDKAAWKRAEEEQMQARAL